MSGTPPFLNFQQLIKKEKTKCFWKIKSNYYARISYNFTTLKNLLCL